MVDQLKQGCRIRFGNACRERVQHKNNWKSGWYVERRAQVQLSGEPRRRLLAVGSNAGYRYCGEHDNPAYLEATNRSRTLNGEALQREIKKTILRRLNQTTA